MFNFVGGRVINREVEKALQDVQEVLNLVDVLARSTGKFLNEQEESSGPTFSNNVSSWLFNNTATSRGVRRVISSRDLQASQCPDEVPTLRSARSALDLDRLIRQEEIQERANPPLFSASGTYADGQNIASSYYSSQLMSHQVSSQTDYRSPRSRYLENQANEVSHMKERLAAFNTAPGRSACELVGPIEPSSKSPPDKKRTQGVAVTLSPGSYSNVQSCLQKSKSMFGECTGANIPNYRPPWERSRNHLGRSLQTFRH